MEGDRDLRVDVGAVGVVLVAIVIGTAGGAASLGPRGKRTEGQGPDPSTAAREDIIGRATQPLAGGKGLPVYAFRACEADYVERQGVVVTGTESDVLFDDDFLYRRSVEMAARTIGVSTDQERRMGTHGVGPGGVETYSCIEPPRGGVLADTDPAGKNELSGVPTKEYSQLARPLSFSPMCQLIAMNVYECSKEEERGGEGGCI